MGYTLNCSFQFLSITNHAVRSTVVHVFLLLICLDWEIYSQEWNCRVTGRNCQIVSQSSCTSVLSSTGAWVPTALYLSQNLVLSVIFILVILVQCSSIYFYTCVSLTTKEVEHLFISLLAIWIFSCEAPVHISCTFIDWVVYLLLVCSMYSGYESLGCISYSIVSHS